MTDCWFWRCAPSQRYRAFPSGQPSVAAVIDGIRILACPSVVGLAHHTPIPVYRPDTGEYGVLDVTDDDRFAPTGTMDDRGYYTGGDQIPEAVVLEMLDWAEQYVRANPDTPLVLRQTGNTGWGGYQTTKTVTLTFNAVYDYENTIRENTDPGLRRAPDRDHVPPGDRTPGTTGTPAGQRGTRARAVDLARRAEPPSMFDGDSGAGRD